MKRLFALLLALVLLLSALPLAGAFSDDANIDDGFKKAVAAMAKKKIINGFEDGSFGPAKALTRAQAAKILCVMLEGEEKANALTKTETGFADVPASHWAAKYVAYCVDKGIVAGVGEGKFDPDGKLSSGAFAKMLLVAYGKDGSKFTGAEWLKNVQDAAETTFYNFHLEKGISNDPMPRQEAAQLAYNAQMQAGADADKAKGDPREYKPAVPESLKLFVIGNSYSNDCTISYLYQELKSLGIKDVVIGILYYSGCSHNQHVEFATQDKPVYKYYYYKNTTKMVTKTKTTFDKSIADEDWTHILVMCGGTTKKRENPAMWQDILLYLARQHSPNAYYFYDMPWSYRTDGQHSDTHMKRMQEFDNDPVKMYENCVDYAKTFGEGEPRYKRVIPVGTAVLNARSSFVGNGVHRDKISHLNKGLGRYVASMSVCCMLTGVTPEQITYAPDLLKNIPAGLSKDTPGMQEALEKVARESVTNMLAKPYEVTQSQFTTAP